MNEDLACRVVGQMDNTTDHPFESANRVYDKDGLCPTIPTGTGGGHLPKILTRQQGKRELMARITDKGIRICQNDEKRSTASEFGTIQKTDTISGAIMPATRKYIMQDESADKKEGDTINAFGRRVDKSGVCPTITTRPEGFKTAILPVVKGEIVRGGLQEHQKPRTDGISPSVTAACGMGGGQTPIFTERRGTLYRIRKLTPRECGRLMGVDDSDIDKMETVNSNSQLYRQFGDSIVVDVMCAMFRKLNIKGVMKDG